MLKVCSTCFFYIYIYIYFQQDTTRTDFAQSRTNPVLTFDLDLKSHVSCCRDSWPVHMQKVKVKGHSVQENKRTDRQMNGVDCTTCLTNTVGNKLLVIRLGRRCWVCEWMQESCWPGTCSCLIQRRPRPHQRHPQWSAETGVHSVNSVVVQTLQTRSLTHCRPVSSSG